MIEDENVLSIGFLKKQVYTGSYKGMRYLLRKEGGEETVLKAIIWPQPANFETSAPESRTENTFPFTKEGRVEAIAWLNQSWEEKKEFWEKAGF